MEQQHFKKKLVSVVNINDSINSLCANRLDFDIQWDFDEFLNAIKEPVERYNKEKQKVIEEIGTKKGNGYEYNTLVLSDKMDPIGKKIIEFDATPISLDAFKKEMERKKRAGMPAEIDGFSLRTLRDEGVIVVENEKPVKDKK